MIKHTWIDFVAFWAILKLWNTCRWSHFVCLCRIIDIWFESDLESFYFKLKQSKCSVVLFQYCRIQFYIFEVRQILLYLNYLLNNNLLVILEAITFIVQLFIYTVQTLIICNVIRGLKGSEVETLINDFKKNRNIWKAFQNKSCSE